MTRAFSIRLVFLALLFITAVFPSLAFAQDEKFQIEGPDPLKFTWAEATEDKQAGFNDVQFRIHNLTGSDLSFRFKLDTPLSTTDNSSIDLEPTFEPETFTLSTGADSEHSPSQLVTMNFKPGPEPPDGVYKSKLTVTAEATFGTGTHVVDIQLRDVEITVPDGKLQPTPLQTTWTVDAIRRGPFLASNVDLQPIYLPLDISYSELDTDQPTILKGLADESNMVNYGREDKVGYLLGLITGEGGDVARVIWTSKYVELTADKTGLELELDELGDIGKYEGKIELFEDEKDKGTVTLTSSLTTHICWPIGAILAGIVLALLSDRWIKRYQKLYNLRIRTGRLLEDYNKANGRFKKKAKNKKYAAYDLHADIIKQQNEILGTKNSVGLLQELEAENPDTIDDENEDYVKLVKKIEAIEEAIKLWPIFAEKLSKLEGALRDNQSSFSTLCPIRNPTAPPRFIATAKEYLEGKPLNLQEFMKFMQGVDDSAGNPTPGKIDLMTNLITTGWRKLKSDLDGYNQVLIDIAQELNLPDEKNPHNPLNAPYYQALTGANTAANLLCIRPDPDQLVKEAQQNLKEAEQGILKLKDLNKDLGLWDTLAAQGALEWGPELMSEQPAGCFPALAALWPRIFGRQVKEETPYVERTESTPSISLGDQFARMADQLTLRSNLINGFFLLLAIVVAVIAGLELTYFDKTFGTWLDFLTVFTLGFATKIGLDLVKTFLGNILKTNSLNS